jgi:hypothetical protein
MAEGDTCVDVDDGLASRIPPEVEPGLFRALAVDDDGPLPALAEIGALAGRPHVALGFGILAQLL